MVCVIDFDGTYFKNDFFKESFFKKVINNPFYIIKHFVFKRGTLLDLKNKLLEGFQIQYEIDFLVNPEVHQWIESNKNRYDKIVLVSASPDFFVKQLLTRLSLFDEIYGSTSKNLKGVNKLEFINEKWGNDFDYVGDSRDDKPIFRKAKAAYKITNRGVINVKR